MNHKLYTKISKQDRHQIIHEVLVNKRQIYEVAREFKVLPSTCKSIINTYIKEGRIGKKEFRIRKLKKVIATYTIIVNTQNPLMSTVQTKVEVTDVEQPSIQSNKKQNKEATEQKPYEFIQEWSKQYIQDYLKMKEEQKFQANHL